MIENSETISIGWIDNQITEGGFTFGLLQTVIGSFFSGRPINSIFRIPGSSISRQRQLLIDRWISSKFSTDWMLLIDSDMYLEKKHFDKLIMYADKEKNPIITGLCFALKIDENNLDKKQPEPCIYTGDFKKDGLVFPVLNFPIDSLIEVDYAGLALTLLHRSVIEKIYKKYPNVSLFKENNNHKTLTIGEDIHFFQLVKDVGIKLSCHTGVNPKHIKRIEIDLDYVLNSNFGKIIEQNDI